MNLREQAESDNAIILEDDVSGFGVAITLTPPNLSAAVSAVLTASIVGVDGTVIPINTRWLSAGKYYRQSAQVTIAGGVAAIAVTAEIAATAGNLADGAVLTLVTPIIGVTSCAVTDTTTAGADHADPDTVYSVKGQVHRVGVDIDPETGLIVPGKKTAITVRLSRFPTNNVPEDGWAVETTDITGSTIKGKISYPLIDFTAGRITFILKR